jgi:hypothetical protein
MRRATALCLFLLTAASAARPAEPEDTAEAALRATVRVHNTASSGTGWFVAVPGADGPRHVLVTANHVFESMKTPECKIVYRAAGKTGVLARREETLAIRDGDKPRWVRHPELDVAAIPVTIPPGVDAAPFAYDRIADETWAAKKTVRTGMDVFVPCFPVRVESNPTGWPLLRKGSIASHPLTPAAAAKTMFLDYAHFEGDSGAPVVAHVKGEPLVVGLVFALIRHTNTVTSPFEERKSHFPLDLAIAVQSPFVRETIDRLKK